MFVMVYICMCILCVLCMCVRVCVCVCVCCVCVCVVYLCVCVCVRVCCVYVTGFWKTDRNVTLGLFHFIGPANAYTHTLHIRTSIIRLG